MRVYVRVGVRACVILWRLYVRVVNVCARALCVRACVFVEPEHQAPSDVLPCVVEVPIRLSARLLYTSVGPQASCRSFGPAVARLGVTASWSILARSYGVYVVSVCACDIDVCVYVMCTSVCVYVGRVNSNKLQNSEIYGRNSLLSDKLFCGQPLNDIYRGMLEISFLALLRFS